MIAVIQIGLFPVIAGVGFGFTTTVTFCVLVHPPEVSVNIYTTLTGLAVVLISTSFGAVVCATVTAALLIPTTAALVHENVAVAGAITGV